VLKGSGNVGVGTIPSYNTPLFIGKHKDFTTERFNGSIDEVRIHNRALPPAEFNLLPSGGVAPEALAPTTASVHIVPNPVVDECVFSVQGQEVEAIQVRVFDLAGALVFDSGWEPGSDVAWQRQNDRGETVANGPYLYVVHALLEGNAEIVLPTGKVFVFGQ
jgi:hypothetical protein